MKLTVICREEGYPSSILVYTVDVREQADEAEVREAVQVERAHDIDDANEMEVLFAFEGDLKTYSDWRE